MLQGDLPFPSVKDIVAGSYRFRKNCSAGKYKLYVNRAFQSRSIHLNRFHVKRLLKIHFLSPSGRAAWYPCVK